MFVGCSCPVRAQCFTTTVQLQYIHVIKVRYLLSQTMSFEYMYLVVGRRSGKAGVRSYLENHKACARRMTILSTASCRSQGAPSDRTTYQSPILQEVRFCHFSGVFRGYSVIFGVGKLCFWRDLGGFYNRIQKLSVQLSTHSL